MAIVAFALLAALGFALVAITRHSARGETNDPAAREQALVERIDRLLPQTQCGQCSYAGCRPYATAIARGEAGINQCPPGGDAGIRALAKLLNRAVLPLDPAHGVEKPKLLALIDEAVCIGCTKCIQACPVDAIIGAPKRMHTVIAELCTGCELCVPPCPVDCIDLVPAPTPRWTRSGDGLGEDRTATHARHPSPSTSSGQAGLRPSWDPA